ncbi:hypothetical protein [Xanthobacter sp.]|uniref:hypothetical protein n=1 Tax=Xanthobacter sp. TaxID=35809 RepID=UPI0025EC2069|nr:hypothetical protein [Xanthobacter sp.]
MARTPSNFVQSDLSRTLRACKDAGVLDRVVVRVEKGVFMIMPVGTASSMTATSSDEEPSEDLPELPEF